MPTNKAAAADCWVLPAFLEAHAASRAGAPWVRMVGEDGVTFGEAHDQMRRAAGYFDQLGVKRGDRVIVMLQNSLDLVRVWLGLTRLGATAVLLNPELSGSFLKHQVSDSRSVLAVIDATRIHAWKDVQDTSESLPPVVIVGRPDDAPGLEARDWAEWMSAPAWEGAMPGPDAIASIMYTSGTTGPAKGVLMPHAHCTLFGVGAVEALALNDRDRYYICLPLFHANGLLMQLGATLVAGAQAIVRKRFSASNWLQDIRASGATVTNFLGATAGYVIAQPPTPLDRQHRLRAVLVAPSVPAQEQVLRTRFRVPDVISTYGMTEVNIPAWGRLGQPAPGSAGYVYEKYFEARIADVTTGQVVPAGAAGELLVRPRLPFGFMAGYHGLPEKTVEAWADLWFHTGDACSLSADGRLTFHDRIKDCIRRRGENIAPSEIEDQVATLAGVAEVAAYAVPSELPGAEDEIMLAVVPKPTMIPDASALLASARRLLPRFASPRFVRFVPELPKTVTGKVMRAQLRREGIGNAFDGDAAPPR